MSVDVFGRNLERSGGSRGPPGVGFKVTSDGQYDIEEKRLRNVASPQTSHDAVNLSTLIEIVKLEREKIMEELVNWQRYVLEEIRKSRETDSENLKKLSEKLNHQDKEIEDIKNALREIYQIIHLPELDD